MNPKDFVVIDRYAVAAMIAEHIAENDEPENIAFLLMEGTPILHWEDRDLVEDLIERELIYRAIECVIVVENT